MVILFTSVVSVDEMEDSPILARLNVSRYEFNVNRIGVFTHDMEVDSVLTAFLLLYLLCFFVANVIFPKLKPA